MLTAVLCALFAQAQPVKLVVVLGSNLGVPEARAADLTRAVVELARLEGFDAAVVEAPCNSQQCFLEAGREQNADAVISVGFAALGKDAVMDLDCRAVVTGEAIAQTTLTVRAETQANLLFVHLPFLRQVKLAFTAGPETPVEKPCPEAPPIVVAEPPSAASRVPYLTGAAGVVAAIASGTLFAINAYDAANLSRYVAHGRISGEQVTAAVAIDDRNATATALMITAGLAFALTLVVALIQQ